MVTMNALMVPITAAGQRIYDRLKLYKFSALLLFQLLFIMVYPLVEGSYYEWMLHVFISFIFLGITMLCTLSLRFRILNALIWGILVVIYALDYMHYYLDIHVLLNLATFQWLYSIVFIVFFIYITLMLCVHMLTDQEPHVDTLAGTAAVYLMVAFTWTFAYLSLEVMIPGSFNLTQHQTSPSYIDWLFFSIGTLVASSFQDVTPISSLARALNILESVIGALYIAIITARIVGVDFTDAKNTPKDVP